MKKDVRRVVSLILVMLMIFIGISNLSITEWKVVVGMYNAVDTAKAQNYSDKVYDYLNPIQELLD